MHVRMNGLIGLIEHGEWETLTLASSELADGNAIGNVPVVDGMFSFGTVSFNEFGIVSDALTLPVFVLNCIRGIYFKAVSFILHVTGEEVCDSSE